MNKIVRVGLGADAHAFCEGDSVVLGGVRIPFSKAIAAHSDGDVVLHAICDALLGAMGMGDLGSFFPEQSVPAGEDSRTLLRRVREALPARTRILNADITVIAQQPILRPFVGEMCRFIGEDLHIHEKYINVKATTTDRMGFIGRGEGIAALATVAIEADEYDIDT